MTPEAISITNVTYRTTNVTKDETTRGEYEIWSMIIPGIFTFFGKLRNIGLLVVIVSTKHLRTVANTMVVNLTVGDLFYLLISVQFHIIHDISPGWDFGWIVCKLSQSRQVAAQGVCVFSLCCFSWTPPWLLNQESALLSITWLELLQLLVSFGWFPSRFPFRSWFQRTLKFYMKSKVQVGYFCHSLSKVC